MTGVKGQLGFDVITRLKHDGIDCIGVDIDDFDLCNASAVSQYFCGYMPTAVIHCAAFTAVDRAEELKDQAFAVNVNGTEHVARACREIGAALMYISTDYVFDGEGTAPFETDSPKNPIGHYGLTKSLGEDAVRQVCDQSFIVRTSWVFGINGHNFVNAILKKGQENDRLSVVCDQIGSPTYTFDLAVLIAEMIQTKKFGVYHATNEGYCSWHEFATEIIKEAHLKAMVKPVTSDQYPTIAARPKNSRLSKESLDRAGFSRLPSWQDALHRYMQERYEQQNKQVRIV